MVWSCIEHKETSHLHTALLINYEILKSHLVDSIMGFVPLFSDLHFLKYLMVFKPIYLTKPSDLYFKNYVYRFAL